MPDGSFLLSIYVLGAYQVLTQIIQSFHGLAWRSDQVSVISVKLIYVLPEAPSPSAVIRPAKQLITGTL
jgi:hypothetical protein